MQDGLLRAELRLNRLQDHRWHRNRHKYFKNDACDNNHECDD